MAREAVIQTECPTCGPHHLFPGDFRCGLDPKTPGLAICEYTCPSCSNVVIFPALAQAAKILLVYGADRTSGIVPFELLERHSAPALTADDVLDFALALQHMETLPNDLETNIPDTHEKDP